MNPNLYRETETHVYFLSGPLSQWTSCSFLGRLEENRKVYTFNSAEQYMMAGKAHLFNDEETLNSIISSKDPAEQKNLGRQVKNYNEKIWNDNSIRIVTNGNIYKFSQNADLKKYILSTVTKILVEGNKRDRIWGVGLYWNDIKIEDKKNWLGLNQLGICLEITRDLLRQQEKMPNSEINPWTRKIILKEIRNEEKIHKGDKIIK